MAVSRGGYFAHQVDAFRRRLVVDALAQAKGNRAQAARILEVSREYMYRLVAHYQLGALFPDGGQPGRPTRNGALPPTL